MLKSDFDDLLLHAVDEVLSTLGNDLTQAIYFNLKRLNITKRQIPDKIEVFTKTIEQIVGSGAVVLEICIAKRLYDKIGIVFEQGESKNLELSGYVKRARRRLYTEFVNSMQNGLAVFHLEDTDDLNSFKLVAVNATASRVMALDRDGGAVENISQIPSGPFRYEVPKILAEVITTGRTRDAGKFCYKDDDGHERLFSATAFQLSSNCVGLAFKNVVETKKSPEPQKDEKQRCTDTSSSQLTSEMGSDHRHIDSIRFQAIQPQTATHSISETGSTTSGSELYESITVSVDLDGEKWMKFRDAVIQPLTNAGVKLKVYVEVSGTSDDGILPETVDGAIKRSLAQNDIPANIRTTKKLRKH